MFEIRDVEGAERLAGVTYSHAEREQMLNNWKGRSPPRPPGVS